MRLSLLSLAAVFALNAQDSPLSLAQGILAGEVNQTSVILQSRLTSASPYVDPFWSGVVGARGSARFEVATVRNFANARRTGWLEARPERDYIVKAFVDGLRPGTRYYYRLVYGPDQNHTQTSEIASFRTLTGPSSDLGFRIAVVTGMNYAKFHYTGDGEDPAVPPKSPPYAGRDKNVGFPGLKAIVKAKADFFIATGDNVYYDTPRVGRAQTLYDMRRKHQEQYSQQRFIDLFRVAGTYWLKDDHDYRFNDSDPYNPFSSWPRLLRPAQPGREGGPRSSGEGSLPSHADGVYAFREQLPVVDPDDPEAVTYRRRRFGKSLELWFVENRDYRSPNSMEDGPEKSIWGKKQREWLERTLSQSDARFKVLISPTPMVGPGSGSKRDNHVNPNGFRHEGDAFFRFLDETASLTPETFFMVCGDRHWKYHAVHPSGFQEFSSGALVDANSLVGIRPGDPASSDPEGAIRHLYHNDPATGGFLLITLDPQGPVLRFEFFDEQGTALYAVEKR